MNFLSTERSPDTAFLYRAMLSINSHHTACTLGGRIYHWLAQHCSLTPPPVLLTGFWRYFPKDAVKKHYKNKLVKKHSSSLFINSVCFSVYEQMVLVFILLPFMLFSLSTHTSTFTSLHFFVSFHYFCIRSLLVCRNKNLSLVRLQHKQPRIIREWN